MLYRVTFNTFAIIEDSTTGKRRNGNVIQTTEVIYTESKLSSMQTTVDTHLESRNLVADIQKIEQVQGTYIS